MTSTLNTGIPAWVKRRSPRDPDTSHGVPCPRCAGDSIVLDSRPRHGTIKRRRACVSCNNRFTTFEIVTDKDPAKVQMILRKQAGELRRMAVMLDQMAAPIVDDEAAA